MTETELIELGFSKEISTGGESDFYYYIYDIVKGLSFISNSNDELFDDSWYVDVFNTEFPIRFNEFNEIKALIEILEKAKLIKNENKM